MEIWFLQEQLPISKFLSQIRECLKGERGCLVDRRPRGDTDRLWWWQQGVCVEGRVGKQEGRAVAKFYYCYFYYDLHVLYDKIGNQAPRGKKKIFVTNTSMCVFINGLKYFMSMILLNILSKFMLSFSQNIPVKNLAFGL